MLLNKFEISIHKDGSGLIKVHVWNHQKIFGRAKTLDQTAQVVLLTTRLPKPSYLEEQMMSSRRTSTICSNNPPPIAAPIEKQSRIRNHVPTVPTAITISTSPHLMFVLRRRCGE